MTEVSQPSPSMRLLIILAMTGLMAFGSRASSADTPPAHFANADDVPTVSAGKVLYMHACASCHGKRLQGQPLWQLEDQYRGQRAPAHDQSGHTWAHSDEDLFRMTRDGRFPAWPATTVSHMPAFRDSLSDEQILSVIAFIKASWPIGLRISQAMLNPGQAGMPANSADVEWTFPPNCSRSTGWQGSSR
jgi:mono/diheme cytochrome c family protein